MITPEDVTACLVTRGDIDMGPILESLIFPNVIVWDNSERENLRTFGRYGAIGEATTPVVFTQDDDLTLTPEQQHALLDAYQPGRIVANVPPWQQDCTFLGYGSVMDKSLGSNAILRFQEHNRDDEWTGLADEGFQMVGCDVIVSVLNDPIKVDAGFTLRPEATGPNRAFRHPNHGAWKRYYINFAEAIL